MPSNVPAADPLRVLRAVRFATRFGFHLHEDIMESAASEPVSDAAAGCCCWLLLLLAAAGMWQLLHCQPAHLCCSRG
jgi:hypothetical protein